VHKETAINTSNGFFYEKMKRRCGSSQWQKTVKMEEQRVPDVKTAIPLPFRLSPFQFQACAVAVRKPGKEEGNYANARQLATTPPGHHHVHRNQSKLKSQP
jgi:hypothetical protein